MVLKGRRDEYFVDNFVRNKHKKEKEKNKSNISNILIA